MELPWKSRDPGQRRASPGVRSVGWLKANTAWGRLYQLPRRPDSTIEVDPEIERRLRALGYLREK